MGSEARRRDRSASLRCALCETRTELGPRRATLPGSDRSRKSRRRSFPHGRVGGCDHQRSATEIIYERDIPRSTSDRSIPIGLGWLKRELAPTRAREISTAIIVGGVVLCVIISMALQVPELSVSRLYGFLRLEGEQASHDSLPDSSGLSALTIGIGTTLLLYKFTYGHPELRIPGMAIALFLGMWLSRVFVLGPLGFLIGFVVAVSQSVGEAVPSPELLVRGLLWLWVAIVYGAALTVVLNLLFLPDGAGPAAHSPKPKSLFVSDAFTNPAHVHFALKVTFAAMFCYIFYSGD